ncbi:hypothetical protein ACIQF6_33960 [Kitasatospora sp. NPDC092948]|uniref:hypothetical protein n=1 Tax=Kitasatospora sp. NPDC092948 TaxID=3364088 RepID=UPI0038246F85
MPTSAKNIATFDDIARRHGRWLAYLAVQGGEFEAPDDPTTADVDDLIGMTRAAAGFLRWLTDASPVITYEDSVEALDEALAYLTAAQDGDGDARSALLTGARRALGPVEDVAEEIALAAGDDI